MSAGECYLTAGQLLARARELGAAITRDYEQRDLVLVVPLRGSFIFGVDLSRSLTLPHEIDFVELEPFHRGTRRLILELAADFGADERLELTHQRRVGHAGQMCPCILIGLLRQLRLSSKWIGPAKRDTHPGPLFRR